MKVLILVMSADINPYILLTNTIKETWALNKYQNIDIYFYYGYSDKENDDENIYFTDIPEGSQNLGYKTLRMFQYIKDFDFDFVFRTNSSSFVNQKKLLDFLVDKPKNNFYCGIVPFTEMMFASGCGYFLSKDLIHLILENKEMWDHTFLDDVALGRLLTSLNIGIDNRATRFDIFNLDGSYNLPKNIDDYYHYRCKYPQKQPWIPDENRDHDIFIMRKLQELSKN